MPLEPLRRQRCKVVGSVYHASITNWNVMVVIVTSCAKLFPCGYDSLRLAVFCFAIHRSILNDSRWGTKNRRRDNR